MQVATRVDGRRTNFGSGWALDARRGLVVTAAHVLNYQPDPGSLSVEIRGPGVKEGASIVGMAPCDDVALLRVRRAARLASLPLAVPGTVRQGDTVFVAGFPTAPGATNLVTARSSVRHLGSPLPGDAGEEAPPLAGLTVVDAGVAPGDSGGPAAGGRGVLFGMVVISSVESDKRFAYAVPATRLRQVLGVLRSGRSLAWRGVTFELPSKLARRGPRGMLITAGVAGAPALRVLGRNPWLLEAVDGKPVGRRLSSYCSAVGRGRVAGTERWRLQTVARGSDGLYHVQVGAPIRTVSVGPVAP